MPNYNSIEGNVLFPTIDGYDMHKADDMALYLAHCDFYPFKSVIDNNKVENISIDWDEKIIVYDTVSGKELSMSIANISLYEHRLIRNYEKYQILRMLSEHTHHLNS